MSRRESRYRACLRVYNEHAGESREEIIEAIAQMLCREYGMKLKPTLFDRIRVALYGGSTTTARQAALFYYTMFHDPD